MFQTIKLNHDQVALVDNDDFEYLNQWKWTALWDKKTKSYRATRTEYYPKKKTVFMHRLIMSTPKDLVCDHINHDTLDNRKENLRNVTNQQNLMNLNKPTTRNSLGVLGVQRHNNKFRAYIMINRKQISGKARDSIEEAIADRKEMERTYFGEFSGNGALA